MQLISQGSYKEARCHVVDCDEEKNHYKAECGRHLSGSDMQRHDFPQDPNGVVNLIICDKCWVELDPSQWKLLRSTGCLPVHQAQNRKLKYKQNESAKKTGTPN